MSRRLLVLAGALSGALLLSACGTADSSTQPTRTIPGSATSTTLPITTTTVAGNFDCSPTTPVVPAEGKPEVTIPDGAAPAALETKDLKVGDGAEAKVGDKVSMQYVGKAKSNGKEFDASWTRNAEPIQFTIGPADPAVKGEVIKGWDQGIAGMKVGGRRLLVIPPDLGYGASAQGDIGANDTLYFVVDLVQVCTPVAATPGSGVPGSSTTVPGAPTGSSTTAIPGSSTTTAAVTSTTATTAASSTTTAAK
jgi:peptidylprolyl isomerase